MLGIHLGCWKQVRRWTAGPESLGYAQMEAFTRTGTGGAPGTPSSGNPEVVIQVALLQVMAEAAVPILHCSKAIKQYKKRSAASVLPYTHRQPDLAGLPETRHLQPGAGVATTDASSCSRFRQNGRKISQASALDAPSS